ncbi:MAG: hypothetical protein B5M48_04820 [Candidatus Omnitrophica bacterium 4484_213]|nr:MAG: hypothetical protein B5M48_04820 [Candidatus Omnitrophica bacterium 4484_213]
MKKGFTLIELIVVIAIIGILAAIIAPNAFKAIEKAKISATIEDYRSIKTAAMSFYADTGTWPADGCEEAFTANDNCASGTYSGWDGPYLEKWPTLAKWGGAYTFEKQTDNVAPYANAWGGNGIEKRFVRITSVPETAAQKISTALDGDAAGDAAADTSGSVRYAETGASKTVLILISHD